MNKKGDIYSIISIMGTVLLVLCFAFMFVLGGGMLKDTMGGIFTEVRAIGNVTENVNVTYYADIVFAPVETILDNYALYASIIYIMGIILIFTLAYIFRDNVNGLNIALFVLSALLIITFAIILSNTYETFYNDPNFMGTQLHEATTISYLILYCPTIMTIVIFIAGIIMMTGKENQYG
jgi:hypothetical protein